MSLVTPTSPVSTISSENSCLLPRQLRRQRQAFSSPPCLPESPADSGYGSGYDSSCSPPNTAENSPIFAPTRPIKELWMLGDGNGSDLDDEDSQASDDRTVFDQSPTQGIAARRQRRSIGNRRPKPATLPIRSPRSRPPLPDSFFSDSGTSHGIPRQRSNIGHVRTRAYSFRLPDRFIGGRTQSTNASERYRTGKEWYQLTPTERILRNNGATEDPFCYRRRIVTPMASNFRIHSRSDNMGSQSRVTGTVLGLMDQNNGNGLDRQVSNGTIWAVGSVAPGGAAVNNGRGQLVRSRTNAPLFRTTFPTTKPRKEEEREKHEARIATALGLDRVSRTLDVKISSHNSTDPKKRLDTPTHWNGIEWVKEGSSSSTCGEDDLHTADVDIDGTGPKKPLENRTLPAAPFKVLDAPNLRDDFYCSILAYSPTCNTLAVGLGNLLYGWSEKGGVRLLNTGNQDDSHLTSVAFSSAEGGKAILAYSRSNKTLGLMSLFDDPDPDPDPGPNLSPSMSRSTPMSRFDLRQAHPVACLSWKPTCTMRPSKCPICPGTLVKTEDLLVGDDVGNVWYYSVEWPDRWEVERHNWRGKMTKLAQITLHTQQICGLSWSPSGDLFATGGNDNLCCLFETAKVLEDTWQPDMMRLARQHDLPASVSSHRASESSAAEGMTEIYTPRTHIPKQFKLGDERYRWVHGAAVKAIAFCPWQPGLVATGGGSNDKCIHFFHTTSGAALATIAVSAQVTSLIWSTTRREIAATFGYAQPEHSVRIAVFSWPECRQVAAIPWAGEHRALYAIPYPGGPDEAGAARNGTRSRGISRTAMEGCIMVASSDKSVKFHEVWAADRKATSSGVGMLGGSDILESLEGIYKEGDVIR